jgi:polar amino acid transport system substrate-binding protein
MKWILALIMLASAPMARAQQQVTLATGDDFAPYSVKAAPSGGLVTHLVKEVLAEMSRGMALEWKTWPEVYDGVRAGKVYGAFPYARTTEREREVNYSDALVETKTLFFTRADDKRNFDAVETLRGVKVCKAKGYHTDDVALFLKLGNLTLVEAKAVKDCLLKLAGGEIDAFPMDELVGWTSLDDHKQDLRRFKTHARVLHVGGLHLIVSKQAPKGAEFLEAFNSALQRIKDSGRYQKIYEQYIAW